MHRTIDLTFFILTFCAFTYLSSGSPIEAVVTDPTTDPVNLDSTETTMAATPAADDGQTGEKKGKDSRSYASPVAIAAAAEETVTNEVSDKNLEDLEFLCHHFYKDEFVVSAHVTEAGCRLECVFLTSSGLHGGGFFDTSVKKHHNINEGQTCDQENDAFKCTNGTCIEPPETGKAVIAIINGTFVTAADEAAGISPYVKVYLDQKYLMKTRTVENTNEPIFKQAFVTPVITSDTQIGFVVFDRNSDENLLLTVQTSVDLLLALRLNGTVTCQPEGSPKGRLCFSVRWSKELG